MSLRLVQLFTGICPSGPVVGRCSLPWERRFGLPGVAAASLIVTNVTFGYFSTNDCGLQSTALAVNPSQVDWSPPVYLSSTTWTSVDSDARMSLGFIDATSTQCTSTGGGDANGCDSYRFALVFDVDGSVGGTPNSTVVSATNPALATGSCTDVSGWGGYYCAGLRLVPSLLLDRLRTTDIRMGPITVTRLDADLRQYFASGTCVIVDRLRGVSPGA